MSKKDRTEFAAMFKRMFAGLEHEEKLVDGIVQTLIVQDKQMQLRMIVRDIADILHENNHRFDKRAFFKECGMGDVIQ